MFIIIAAHSKFMNVPLSTWARCCEFTEINECIPELSRELEWMDFLLLYVVAFYRPNGPIRVRQATKNVIKFICYLCWSSHKFFYYRIHATKMLSPRISVIARNEELCVLFFFLLWWYINISVEVSHTAEPSIINIKTEEHFMPICDKVAHGDVFPLHSCPFYQL